jgi:energy-coupling factor transporter ATP-binding protein EcfA2
MPEVILQAKALGSRFPDGVWAFRNIDFKLNSGEISVLSGRNGVGKTIFAKHLAGLLVPTEGSVLIGGINLKDIKGSNAARVGYVFQDARLQIVGDTVLDDLLFGPTNLGVPKAQARQRAEVALASCGLKDKSNAFVHGLSGGEMRLLAIAGVLTMLPDALILDEPFANLDPSGVGKVLALVKETSAAGITILIVTHEIEKILGLASSFAIMDSGRIVLEGKPAEVLAAGIESYGLRDPYRPRRNVEDLQWL